jgi:hypothetical protein
LPFPLPSGCPEQLADVRLVTEENWVPQYSQKNFSILELVWLANYQSISF